MDEVRDVRMVEDVETLKALSDPLRLSILQTMGTVVDDRSWTAKELARELGQPQTKLYRHLKHLEEVGLIRVAETRVVSGIVEQRYIAAQRNIQFGRSLLAAGAEGSEETRATAFGVIQTAMTTFEQELAEAFRAGRIQLDADEESRRPMVVIADYRLSAERAESYRQRLRELVAELNAEPGDPEGVPVHLMLTMYRPDE